MKFTETKLKGAFIVTPDIIEDERGFFTRTFCRNDFHEQSLNTDIVQCNISFNKISGTLRGMHYQAQPHSEVKLVRCTAGVVYDVIVDLRPGSPTFRQWFALNLSAENHLMIYIPEGFAHGFQTLTDGAEVTYQHSAFYSREHQRGVRYDDPAFAVVWPLPVSVISPRDENFALVDSNFKGVNT